MYKNVEVDWSGFHTISYKEMWHVNSGSIDENWSLVLKRSFLQKKNLDYYCSTLRFGWLHLSLYLHSFFHLTNLPPTSVLTSWCVWCICLVIEVKNLPLSSQLRLMLWKEKNSVMKYKCSQRLRTKKNKIKIFHGRSSDPIALTYPNGQRKSRAPLLLMGHLPPPIDC